MHESARHATIDDLPRLVELATTAVDELRPTRGGELWARREARPGPAEDALKAALADPDHLVLVGQLDETVVGYAVARLELLRDDTLLAVLDDLYVEPGARAVGVGELMMNMVIEWATENDCFGIDSIALPGNRATKNFFESFGLVARAILVHRRLKDG